jgi:hypothetical protein
MLARAPTSVRPLPDQMRVGHLIEALPSAGQPTIN